MYDVENLQNVIQICFYPALSILVPIGWLQTLDTQNLRRDIQD